jgi:hypothetical protein
MSLIQFTDATLIFYKNQRDVYYIEFIVPRQDDLRICMKFSDEEDINLYFNGPIFAYSDDGQEIKNPTLPNVLKQYNVLVLNGVKYAVRDKHLNNIDYIEEFIYYTYRKDTINLVHKNLEENFNVLIKAPPFCGKTTLLLLYLQYLESINENSYYINCSSISRYNSFEEYFFQEKGKNWIDLYKEILNGKRVYFLLDEAQCIYNTETVPSLWELVKKYDIKKVRDKNTISRDPRFLFISNYNDKSSKVLHIPTSFKFFMNHKDIALKDDEYKEIVDNYNYNRKEKDFQQISVDIAQYIRNLTQSHIGLFHRTLNTLSGRFHEKETPDKEFLELLLSTDFLMSLSTIRIFPKNLDKYFELYNCNK